MVVEIERGEMRISGNIRAFSLRRHRRPGLGLGANSFFNRLLTQVKNPFIRPTYYLSYEKPQEPVDKVLCAEIVPWASRSKRVEVRIFDNIRAFSQRRHRRPGRDLGANDFFNRRLDHQQNGKGWQPMNFRQKSSLLMFFLGSTLLLAMSTFYFFSNRTAAIKQARATTKNMSETLARTMGLLLLEKNETARTIGSIPLLVQAIKQSNSVFSRLNDGDREKKISDLNEKWLATTDNSDPLILEKTQNLAANYLRKLQKEFPNHYGEIFLTNRYGVVVATTGRLTTLAHAHKYWWKASYNDGKGKTYFDDRGYDTSVKGFVLGVVIPVMQGNEIIGILKCNLYISHLLAQVFERHHNHDIADSLLLARCNGLIVFAKGLEPLTSRLPDKIIAAMVAGKKTTLITKDKNEKKLFSFFPINLTQGNTNYGFGGTRKSIDHRGGSEGNVWHIISSQPLSRVFLATTKNTKTIVGVGLAFCFIMALGAWFLGKTLSSPITQLIDHSLRVGQGDFNIETNIPLKGDIGALAKTFNTMTATLKETMISRDRLQDEIEHHKKTAEERDKALHEMTERVKELSGLFSVSRAIREEDRIENMLQAVVNAIPPSWQYPDITSAVIAIEGQSYFSTPFARSPWCLTQYIEIDNHKIGQVKVYYSVDHPDADEGPFLKEERHLLTSICHLLAETIENRKAQEEARESYKQLFQADKLVSLGTLVSGVAHEINNPNHIIMTHVSPLKKAWDGARPVLDKYYKENGDFRLGSINYSEIKEQIPTMLANIMGGSNRIKIIVDELRDYIREQPKEFTETLQINCVAQSAHTLLGSLVKASTDNFSLSLPDNIPPILGNYQRLEQVVVNLLENACHALPNQGSTIILSTDWDKTAQELWVQVEDQGCGIPAENLNRIEDLFFTTKRESGGLGLGLSISSIIAREHSGRLEFISTPGKGTKARLVLPLKETHKF